MYGNVFAMKHPGFEKCMRPSIENEFGTYGRIGFLINQMFLDWIISFPL